MRRTLKLLTISFSSFLSLAVSHAQDSDFDEFESEFEEQNVEEISDPLIKCNRFFYRANDSLYEWVLRPVAKGYGKVVPEGGRTSINKFFKNIAFPIRFVNNILQLKPKGTGVEFSRFAVNSTVGILGFFDPAKSCMDLEPYDEDFGQTLGHYGVGGGAPIILPFFGQSNVRDAIGQIPDYFLNPLSYITPVYASTAVKIYDKENLLSLHYQELDSLREEALDPYVFFRDVYQKTRKNKIEE